MRTFKEAAEIFDVLRESEAEDYGAGEVCTVSTILKWTEAVSRKLYPQLYKQTKFNSYHLNNEGCFMDGSQSVEEDGEYIRMASVAQSDIPDYALVYAMNSPYWKMDFDYLNLEEGIYSEDGNENDMPMLDLLKRRFKGFIEEELLGDLGIAEEHHPLYSLYGMFEKDMDVADDMCGIRSILYPYLRKAKLVAGKEFFKHIDYIERAFSVLGKWLNNGVSVCVEGSEYTYFFCSDGSSDVYCYGMKCGGAIDFSYEVIIAAELIESAMFEIHEKYPFLDERILSLRKEDGFDAVEGRNLDAA